MRPALFLVAAILSVPCAAAAEEASPRDAYTPRVPAIELALAVGTGFVAGSAESGVAMADQIKSPIAPGIDVDYRASSRWSFGLHTKLAFGLGTPGGCPSGYDCNAALIGFGAHARFHPIVEGRIDPWIGVGAGLGILESNVTKVVTGSSDLGPTSNALYRQKIQRYGLELPVIEGGIDYRITRQLGIGVFALASFGLYFVRKESLHDVTQTPQDSDSSGSTSATMHEWFAFGVRAVYAFELGH